MDEKGRLRRRFLYIGDYYTADAAPEQMKRRGTARLALAVWADILVIYALTRNTASNREGVLAGITLLMLFPCFFVTWGAVCHMFRKIRMTKAEYKETVLFVKIGSLIGAVSSAVLAVWHGGRGIRQADGNERADGLRVMASLLLVSLLFLCAFIEEARTHYRIIPSDKVQAQRESTEEEEM